MCIRDRLDSDELSEYAAEDTYYPVADKDEIHTGSAQTVSYTHLDVYKRQGIIYLGPVDGSDIKEMCRVFDEAKRVDGPVLVHVLTKKRCV